MMNVTLGKYSATGPRCMLQQLDGIRAGRCPDGGSTAFQPGGETQVYPCMREWYQFVSFGDGSIAPPGSLYSTIPFHIVKQIRAMGHDHIPFMCLGVFERGDRDEYDWDDVEHQNELHNNVGINYSSYLGETETWAPLSQFQDARIVTTQCSNIGAVIEWVFVPFILEEEIDQNTTIIENSENFDTSSFDLQKQNATQVDDQEL